MQTSNLEWILIFKQDSNLQFGYHDIFIQHMGMHSEILNYPVTGFEIFSTLLPDLAEFFSQMPVLPSVSVDTSLTHIFITAWVLWHLAEVEIVFLKIPTVVPAVFMISTSGRLKSLGHWCWVFSYFAYGTPKFHRIYLTLACISLTQYIV